MADTIEVEHAIFHPVSPNEFGIDQKATPDGEPTWDDPVKLRFGAFRPYGRDKFYLGTVSLDMLVFNPQRPTGPHHRIELGFLALKLDSEPGEPARPCIEFHLQRDATTTSDADMLCCARVSSKGIEIDPKRQAAMGIFLRGIPLAGTVGASSNELRHPNGIQWLVLQDDDNFVAYRNRVPYDYATGVPTFASAQLQTQVRQLEARVARLEYAQPLDALDA